MAIDIATEKARIDSTYLSPEVRVKKYNELLVRVEYEQRQPVKKATPGRPVLDEWNARAQAMIDTAPDPRPSFAQARTRVILADTTGLMARLRAEEDASALGGSQYPAHGFPSNTQPVAPPLRQAAMEKQDAAPDWDTQVELWKADAAKGGDAFHRYRRQYRIGA
jgi:hypothetical protein